MITTGGKLHIKRYMAGIVPAIAQSIAYGVGNKALAVGDTKLQFETGRADIVSTSLDLINNRIVYKAVIPQEDNLKIYEFGLYSSGVDVAAGQFSSKLITTFDSDTEDWVNAAGTTSTFASTAARIGIDSLRQAPAVSASATDSLNQLALDLSGYSGRDVFSFAFNCANANASAIRVRFLSDGANFYDFNLGSQSTGYKFIEMTKASATATGTPNWASITSIQITTVANATAAASVDFDGIRIEDVDTNSQAYVLVSREVVSVISKDKGKLQEIEFSIGISA